jgi:hypothetical protein
LGSYKQTSIDTEVELGTILEVLSKIPHQGVTGGQEEATQRLRLVKEELTSTVFLRHINKYEPKNSTNCSTEKDKYSRGDGWLNQGGDGWLSLERWVAKVKGDGWLSLGRWMANLAARLLAKAALKNTK